MSVIDRAGYFCKFIHRHFCGKLPPAALCVALLLVANDVFAGCRVHYQDMEPAAGSHTIPSLNLPVGGQSRPPAIETAAEIQPWKTITLGTYQDLRTLRAALAESGCFVGDSVEEMFSTHAFVLSKEMIKLDLVVLSVAELGFKSEASLAAINARARQFGLQLCPPEVGPQLRLQYPDQPLGEFLHIAIQPIPIHNGEFDDLMVGNGGAGLFITGGSSSSDQLRPWNVKFVFIRQRANADVASRH